DLLEARQRVVQPGGLDLAVDGFKGLLMVFRGGNQQEVTGHLPLSRGPQDIGVVDLLAVEGDHRGALAAGPEPRQQLLEDIGAVAGLPDEDEHAEHGQPGEDYLLMFAKPVEGAESHDQSSFRASAERSLSTTNLDTRRNRIVWVRCGLCSKW